METDVYCVCPQCNGFTNAKGSGDSEDLITCGKCGISFAAIKIGKLKPWTAFDLAERFLYAKKGTLDKQFEVWKKV
jgi:hypothetical protein